MYNNGIAIYKGADISKWNWSAPIDFNKVKACGIQVLMIRAGFGKLVSQKDPRFEEAYAGAVKAGIGVGAYWYSYAQSTADAINEAKACLEVIKGKKFDFPIYYDMEEQGQLKLGKAACSAMIDAFCTTISEAGYFSGVYSYDSFFATNVNADIFKKHDIWCARVENIKPKSIPNDNYGIWQYSFKGKVDGIKGDVDLDYFYRDYPAIIKKAGLNGYQKTTETIKITTKFKITAEILECTKDEADTLEIALSKLGMKVKREAM